MSTGLSPEHLHVLTVVELLLEAVRDGDRHPELVRDPDRPTS